MEVRVVSIRATKTVRNELWSQLDLDLGDGTIHREQGVNGDVIVLSLQPSLINRYHHITSFRGFQVRVQPVAAAAALHA